MQNFIDTYPKRQYKRNNRTTTKKRSPTGRTARAKHKQQNCQRETKTVLQITNEKKQEKSRGEMQ